MNTPTWFGWAFAAWYGLVVLVTIARIGAPRKPLTPLDGVCTVIIAALVVFGAVTVGTIR